MKIVEQMKQKEDSKLLKWADDVDAKSSPPARMARAIIRFLIISLGEFKNNDLSVRSGALTYTILLSLVPVLAMSTAVVKGLGGGDQLKDVAYSYIETLEKHNAPPQAEGNQPESPAGSVSSPEKPGEAAAPPGDDSLTGHLRSALDTLFSYVDNTNFAALGSFGIAGVLFSVLLVFSNIEKALNRIWHVENGRSILRRIADYITIMVLMPISINVAFAASAFLKHDALSEKFTIFVPFAWLQTFILQLVPIFFITLTFFVIYIFFPNTKVRRRPALAGALFAAFFWFWVQNIYISMQVGVAKYNAIYGSFATVPLFLVWMYLGWMFILAGAQIAYTIQNLSNFRLIPTSSIPSVRLSAAFDILDQVQQSYANHSPATRESLVSALPQYERALIEDITDELSSAEFLYDLGEDNRLLPSGPSGSIEKRDVIDLILGVKVPDTEGGKMSSEALEAAAARSAEKSDDAPKPAGPKG